MYRGKESYAWVHRPPEADAYDYTIPERVDTRLASNRHPIPSRWR